MKLQLSWDKRLLKIEGTLLEISFLGCVWKIQGLIFLGIILVIWQYFHYVAELCEPNFPANLLTLMTFLNCSSAHPRAWRWNSTKACERALQYQVGEKIHGFTVSQVRPDLTSLMELVRAFEWTLDLFSSFFGALASSCFTVDAQCVCGVCNESTS